MNEVSVFNHRSLTEWQETLLNEIEHRRKKKNMKRNFFISFLVSAITGAIGYPFLMWGWLYEDINWNMVALLEGILILMCLFVIYSSYKDYKREKRLYERLVARSSIRPESKNAFGKK